MKCNLSSLFLLELDEHFEPPLLERILEVRRSRAASEDETSEDPPS